MFVKICGTTNEADALLAVAMGADAVGFVLAASPRRVHPEVVRDIVKRLPHETVTIGVFRDERPEHVVDIVSRCGLRGAQLHGGETDADVAFVRDRVAYLIRALPAGDPRLAKAAGMADVILLDAPEPGSGQVFDWSLAEGAPDGVRLMLAGGLDPDNVAEAIRKVRPWGVDVASGVESAPGQKDPAKLRRFVDAAKRAGAALEETPAAPGEPGADHPYDWAEEP